MKVPKPAVKPEKAIQVLGTIALSMSHFARTHVKIPSIVCKALQKILK